MWEVPALAGIALALPMLPALLTFATLVTPGLMRISGGARIVLALGSWLVALLAMLILGLRDGEISVGGWQPTSLTGMPLILRFGFDNTLIALAGTTALLGRWMRRGVPGLSDGLISAAWLGLACATSWPALLVGVGVLDLVTAFGREDDMVRQSRRNIINGISVAMVGIACVVQLSAGASNYLPLATLGPTASWWAVGAATLRILSTLLAPGGQNGVWTTASGFVLLDHFIAMGAPRISGVWFAGIALVALIKLAHAFLYRRVAGAQNLLAGASALLVLALLGIWQADSARYAAVGLLLGLSLISHSSPEAGQSRPQMLADVVLRAIGAAVLCGLPLLPVFPATAGGAAHLQSGFAGAVTSLVVFAGIAFLTASSLDLVLRAGDPTMQSSAENIVRPQSVALIAPLLCVALAVWAGLAGGLAAFGRMSIADWLVRVAGWLAGAGLWWMDGALTNRLNIVLGELWRVAITQRVAEVLDLDWGIRAVGRSLQRIGRPFSAVFVFLESEGALLWTLVAVLAFFLVTRSAGP